MFKTVKDKFVVLLKIAVSIGLLYYIFKKFIDIEVFQNSIQNLAWIYVIPVIGFSLISRILMATQTRTGLLQYGMNFTTFDVIKVQSVSTLYSLILPGDFAAGAVSWYYFSKSGGQRAQAAALLLFLRIFNLAAMAPLALLGVLLEPRLAFLDIFLPLSFFTGLLILAVLPFLWKPFAVVCRKITLSIIRIIRWKRLEEAGINFWNAVNTCSSISFKPFFSIIASTVAIHFFGMIAYWFLCYMVGISISFFSIFFIRALVIIILSVPLTLAGTGLREISLIYLLNNTYGIDPSTSLLFSLLTFAIMVIVSALPGLFFLHQIHEIKQQSELNSFGEPTTRGSI